MKIFEVSLTNYCNFKCSYCISNTNRGYDKFSQPIKLSENGLLKIHPDGMLQEEYDRLKETAHDGGDWLNLNSLRSFIYNKLDAEWVINLTGGEPLQYPNLDEFIRELTKTNNVVITTNGSLIKSQKELVKVNRNKLFFRIGYHPEFRSSIEFIRNMEYFIDNNFKYIINYVLHPTYYINSTKYSEHIQLLVENQYEYEVTPFEGKFNGVSYPTPIKDRTDIEKSLLSIHQNNNITKSPIGDKFILSVPEGDIYECQSRDVKLGNIYKNTLQLINQSKLQCFNVSGCSPVNSANNYLKIFLNNKLG